MQVLRDLLNPRSFPPQHPYNVTQIPLTEKSFPHWLFFLPMLFVGFKHSRETAGEDLPLPSGGFFENLGYSPISKRVARPLLAVFLEAFNLIPPNPHIVIHLKLAVWLTSNSKQH